MLSAIISMKMQKETMQEKINWMLVTEASRKAMQ